MNHKIKILIFSLVAFTYSNNIFAQGSRKAQKLTNNVNSAVDELSPIISTDGKQLFFVRSNSPENIGGEKAGQDIWISDKQADGTWGKAYNASKPINNKEHNALGGISKSGNKVYASNQYQKKQGGISTFNYSNKSFSFDKIIWEGSEMFNEGFFSFYINQSEDIMILSFSNSKENKEDLYVSLNKGGTWSQPKSLGTKINTRGYEISPFLMKDSKTLFFASNGYNGMGDADIYMSKRIDDTWENWTTPKNVGKNANTAGFDAYLSLSEDEKTAYFCSGDNAESSSDIYSVLLSDLDLSKMDTVYLETEINKKLYGTISELLKKNEYKFFGGAKSKKLTSILEVTEQADFLDYVPPTGYKGKDTLYAKVCKAKDQKECDSLVVIVTIKEAVFQLKMEVVDKKSGKALEIVPEVLNADTKQKFPVTNKSTGNYLAEIPVGNMVDINISEKGFFPYYDKINLSENNDNKVINKKIELTALETGNTITLKNILFETAKADLKSDSFESLDKLVNMMMVNKEVKILISGHTDNVGNNAYNLDLSQKRVNSVANYLKSKGIDGNRLKSQGFGAGKPIADNKTEEGKQLNRRVEVTIL